MSVTKAYKDNSYIRYNKFPMPSPAGQGFFRILRDLSGFVGIWKELGGAYKRKTPAFLQGLPEPTNQHETYFKRVERERIARPTRVLSGRPCSTV